MAKPSTKDKQKLFNEARACIETNKLEEASNKLKEIIKLDPQDLNSLGLLINIMLKLNQRTEELAQFFELAIRLQASPDAILALASLYWELNMPQKAINKCRQCIEKFKQTNIAYINLAQYQYITNDLSSSIETLESAIKLFPEDAEINHQLGLRYLRIPLDFSKGEELARKAINLGSNKAATYTAILFSYYYNTEKSLKDIKELASEIAAKFYNSSNNKSFTITKKKSLNIGFVSADFRKHPVGYIINSILQDKSDEDLNYYFYYNEKIYDEVTNKLKQKVTKFKDISALKTPEAVKLIQEDSIDILFDLSGYTKGHRLDIFAIKPAPIQISWLGYFGTTGLKNMDYILADNNIIRPGEEKYFTEKIALLPSSYFSHELTEELPELTDPPCIKNGFITFGSTNKLIKVNEAVIETWSKVLKQVPSSKLKILGNGFQDQKICKRYDDVFNKFGVDSSRVEYFEAKQERLEYLDFYNSLDIVLDTFPFCSGSVAPEAMFMGAPIITIDYGRWVSRLPSGVYKDIGFTDLISNSKKEYIEKAINLANDFNKIKELKYSLKNMILNSGSNSSNFTKGFEETIREIWKDNING